MHSKYGIKDLDPISKFTSYQVHRNRLDRTITLHQSSYINEVLKLSNMIDAVAISNLPTSINFLSKSQSPTTIADKQFMSLVPYSVIVGALLHISGRTRPELSHSVSIVARFSSNPGILHWNAVKSILRYLKGTINYGLVLGGHEHLRLVGYIDANFA